MLNRSSNPERFDFLRRAFDALPAEEMDGVLILASNCKKRRIRASKKLVKRRKSESPTSVAGPDQSVSVPKVDVSTSVSAPDFSVSEPKIDVPTFVSALDFPTPVSEVSKSDAWFSKYKDDDIIAIDVEKVSN